MRQNNILTMANSLCSVLAGKVFPLRGHLLIKRHFLRGWSLAFYISSIQKSPFISKVVLEYTHDFFLSLCYFLPIQYFLHLHFLSFETD